MKALVHASRTNIYSNSNSQEWKPLAWDNRYFLQAKLVVFIQQQTSNRMIWLHHVIDICWPFFFSSCRNMISEEEFFLVTHSQPCFLYTWKIKPFPHMVYYLLHFSPSGNFYTTILQEMWTIIFKSNISWTVGDSTIAITKYWPKVTDQSPSEEILSFLFELVMMICLGNWWAANIFSGFQMQDYNKSSVKAKLQTGIIPASFWIGNMSKWITNGSYRVKEFPNTHSCCSCFYK